MSTEYKLNAGIDYCPLKEGEDMCLGCSPCNYKGIAQPNKILEMIQKIKIAQADNSQEPALAGD
ncbi:hypothetical protein JW707_03045 [Candidatus Woesearchaeota archaeon]|nr:hypothetical protein [Candidatus Woesearchaeota archaeon]